MKIESKPSNYRNLLTLENAKTIKGEKLGYLTGILYLAPANEAGRGNVCAASTKGCREGCLFTAGRASFTPSIITARIEKTNFLFDNREAFLASLRYDIAALIRKAKRERLTPAVRINGTSDLPWLAMMMASEFPAVQFYDYTKLAQPWNRTLSNYHLTFSHSEENGAACIAALAHGINVAVVFDTKRGADLPSEFMGARVVDGDEHDLRFLNRGAAVIIGLRAKGEAKKDTTGFVVESAFVQIAVAA
jgi:hypothetical protein